MKSFSIALVIIILFLVLNTISAQISEWGISIGNNFASHTNLDPTIPEDGQFQWDNLNGINLGAFASIDHVERWKVRSSLNFQQKGYTEFATTGIIGGPFQGFTDNILSNKLFYITLRDSS